MHKTVFSENTAEVAAGLQLIAMHPHASSLSSLLMLSAVHIDICLHAVFPGWVPTSGLTLGLGSPVAEKMKVGIKETRVARW